MTVKITHDLNSINSKLSSASNITRDKIVPIFKKFAADIFTDILYRSPVDSGMYRADWELNYSYGTDGGMTAIISNNMPYAGVMETGSPIGGAPWPGAGLKTVEREGRIWSSQRPEPVGDGALKSSDLDGLSKEISKKLDEVL